MVVVVLVLPAGIGGSLFSLAFFSFSQRFVTRFRCVSEKFSASFKDVSTRFAISFPSAVTQIFCFSMSRRLTARHSLPWQFIARRMKSSSSSRSPFRL